MNAWKTVFTSAALSLMLAAGAVAPALAQDEAAANAPAEPIDFGDDASEWAHDGECDDPRFTGPAAAVELLEADRLHDATDCRTAFEQGRLTLITPGDASETAGDTGSVARIIFGDDSGEWAHDGECDDPDFVGAGMTAKPSPESRLHDASDCRAAFEQGTIALASAGGAALVDFDYGSDTSVYAYDGECDDPRFEGPGTDKKLLADDMLADANDCQSLEARGEVSIRTVYRPDYAAGAPYDSTGIIFGDDSSSYALDGECDDPRFEGPGAASTLLDSDSEHDATDCRTAYEAGLVMLR